MKNLLFLIVLILVSCPVFSQKDSSQKKFKHEVNLGRTHSYHDILTLGYKRHYKNKALRLSVGVQPLNYMGKDNFYQNTIDVNFSQLDSKLTDVSVASTLGLEFYRNFKKTQLLYGSSVFYSYKKEHYTYYRAVSSCLTGVQIPYSIAANFLHRFGVLPFLGFQYAISPRISILSEWGFELNFGPKNQRKYYYSAPGGLIKTKDKSSQWVHRLGNFSINLHF
ncbi:MAG: hypothetical protein ACRCVT_09005 [Leadbetterella sp.]